METFVRHLSNSIRHSHPNRWMRGALLGLLSAVAVLTARWMRRSKRAPAQPSPTLELDLSDLLPSGPPQLPGRADGRTLQAPDVHAFEIH
jgi:hypothetical protein